MNKRRWIAVALLLLAAANIACLVVNEGPFWFAFNIASLVALIVCGLLALKFEKWVGGFLLLLAAVTAAAWVVDKIPFWDVLDLVQILILVVLGLLLLLRKK
jgi:hypothetical protein